LRLGRSWTSTAGFLHLPSPKGDLCIAAHSERSTGKRQKALQAPFAAQKSAPLPALEPEQQR
jgi:hypothetical protein